MNLKKTLLLFALLTASVVAFAQGPSTPITYPVSDPTGLACVSTYALYQGRLFVCSANIYRVMPTVSNSTTGFVNYPFTSPAGALCTKNGTQDPPLSVFNGVAFSCQSSAYTAITAGGGGSPGGTNGQAQYNNGGTFGGFTFSGDITVVTSTGVATLATVNSGPGACGDATHVCVVTTDGKGRVLSQTATAISGAGGGSPAGSTNAVQYNGGGGSFSGLNSPVTNGNCVISFNVTGAAAVPPTCAVAGVTVTANSGNYSLLYSDRVAYLKFSGGTTATLTLCQITGTCANNFPFVVQNLNSGTLTITANAADKIDNGSTGGSITVPANSVAFVYQDSSSAPGNWWSIKLANSTLAIKSGDTAGGSLAGTFPNPTLTSVATPGTCGDATHSCTVTITAEGRVTAITNNVISGAGGGAAAQVAETVTTVNNAASPYTVLTTDAVLRCDASGGAVVFTLPAATATLREYTFKKTDNSGNLCTINRAGSDLIDGQTSIVISNQNVVQKIQDVASAVWNRLLPYQYPLFGNGSNTGVGASSTNFVPITYGASPNATEGIRASGFPVAGVLTNFCVTVSTGQSGTGALVATFRDTTGAADTAATVTFGAGASAGTQCDNTNVVPIVAHRSYVVKFVNSATASSAQVTAITALYAY